MKRIFLTTLVATLLLPFPAFAHPGGTDANGGHTDRETGDYHYHHGYEAHYHTGGVCPFAFDDQTGSNSGEPSDSSDSVHKEAPDVEWVEIANGWWHNPDLDQWRDPEGNIYTGLEYYEALGYTYHEDIGIWTGPDGIINKDGIFQSYDDIAAEIEAGEPEHVGLEDDISQPYDEIPDEIEAEVPEHVGHTRAGLVSPVLDGLFLILTLLLLFGPLAVHLVRTIVGNYKAKKARKRAFAEEQAHYQSLYGGKTKQEVARMCGMPDMVSLGEDGLPREIIFFVSKSGKAFHRSASCNMHATIPCHAQHLGDRIPCTRCRPVRPDLSWYDAYRTALRNIEKYKVTHSDKD